MKFVKCAKIAYIVSSVLMIALGLVLIIWPQIGLKIACYVVGAVACLFGIAKIVGYFSKDLFRLAFQFDLSLGILAILLGAVIIITPDTLGAALPYIFGIYALIDGIAKLQISIDAKRFGLKNWWILIMLSVLTCGAGILLMVYPNAGATLILILLGVSLIADGIENLCTVIYTVKVLKNFNSDNIEAV